MSADALLINFYYAHPVGHVIEALADYFPALLAAHQCDPSALWSLDDLHTAYI